EKKMPRLLLTAAVSAGSDTVRGGYDVPAVAAYECFHRYADFLNVMSYDFHGKWEPKTGHNAPLFSMSSETEWRKQLSLEFGVKMWERMGAPKDKIVVGLATYGRSFTLTNPSNNGMNAPTSGGGKAGEFSRESGFLAFYEICEMMKNGATYIWDDEQKVPYLVDGDQWVGFDDERSIRVKTKWLLENDYAGAMVWTVDMDDFTGKCSGRKYPLIEVMGEELIGRPKSTSNLESIVQKASSNPLIKVSVPNTESNIIHEKPDLTPTTSDSIKSNALSNDDETNARIVCYYTNWSNKRPGIGKFEPEHLDPTLCTHIIFAFANLNSEFKISPSEESDETKGSQTGLYD
ncbi:unnamed protein product, partial [Oppiella nova]